MIERAYILLSGGIDSTTCLHIARSSCPEVIGVSVDYGQRHTKEILYAIKTCFDFGLEHRIINLTQVVPKTMLTDSESEIPSVSYAEIEGVSPTYVPFRNGLMLSALTSLASGEMAMIKQQPKEIKEWGLYFGAHMEDAANWAYPDCTPEFIGAMANAIYIGTYHTIRLITPLQWMKKGKIIQLGTELGVNWINTWSCYAGGEFHCGVCPTCRARKQGFIEAGVVDPTVYEAN